MDKKEYEQIKNLSYIEYCNYLQNKYGFALYNYFNENFTLRNSISRTSEGLFAHHKMENKAPNLSNIETAKLYPYEYQQAENIIYCDALEHLLLHELISETPNIPYSLGIGGARKIIASITNLYSSQNLQPWELNCKEVIKDQQDVFELLKDRLNDRSFLLEHNENVYAILEDTLEHSNKALVLIGTGGGKTTTALEYQRLHNTNTLVLCPTHIIQDGWKGHNNITTITHAGFLSQYKSIDFNNYNLIIIDEAHHMASSTKAGQALKQVMHEHPEIKFIGLTAESKRNDGLIIAQDMYDNNLCEGVTVLDGIKNGSLYPFSYVGAYYDTNSLKKEYEHEALKGELDLAINNTPTLKNIILSNMPAGPRKGIIFVSTIEAIPEALAIMKDIYPNAEYRSIYSGMNANTIEANKEWFKHTTEGYLISINMISEGAHYKGVNTLIMFRHTESPLVFNQQLGRVITLTKYDNPNAIVFDLVNNAFTTFEDKHDYGESKEIIKLLQDISKKQGERQAHKSENIIVKDYTSDIDKVLEKIKEANSDKWLDWEIDILKKYYETEGPEACYKKLISNYEIKYGTKNTHPHTINAVYRYASYLGLEYKSDVFWTKQEEDILLKFYPTYGASYCVEKLAQMNKYRNESAVTIHANKYLDLNRDVVYTEDEINIIKDIYPKYGVNKCVEVLSSHGFKRTKASVQSKAIKDLALESIYKWSTAEDNILIKYYPQFGLEKCLEEITKLNTTRTKEAILRRTSVLGLKKKDAWSKEAVKILIEYYSLFGAKFCKQKLESINIFKTSSSITTQAQKLGLKKVLGKSLICIETKTFFDNLNKAEKYINISKSSISNACNGKRSTAGGYHWRWATEEETKVQKCLD